MLPKVTIGVCVKNGAATLREAIESIISQNYPHELIEVIFVDDGSEDETLLIINAYASKMDMDVKIFRHEWRGLGVSRNVVVDNASGKYIIWVDGDMIIPKDHVRKQIDFMEKNKTVGIAKAKHGFLQGSSTIAFLENLPYIVLDIKSEEKVRPGFLGTGGSIYRVKAIRQVGGFNEKLRVAEDIELGQRLKKIGRIAYLTDTFAISSARRYKKWGAWRAFYHWLGSYFYIKLLNKQLPYPPIR